MGRRSSLGRAVAGRTLVVTMVAAVVYLLAVQAVFAASDFTTLTPWIAVPVAAEQLTSPSRWVRVDAWANLAVATLVTCSVLALAVAFG